MSKAIQVILLSLFLAGCITTPEKVPSERIIHPEMPAPVQPYRFDWKVVVIDDKTAIVGLGYDDSIEFRIFLEDVKRYIKETNAVLCQYREDLKEPRCVKEKGN